MSAAVHYLLHLPYSCAVVFTACYMFTLFASSIRLPPPLQVLVLLRLHGGTSRVRFASPFKADCLQLSGSTYHLLITALRVSECDRKSETVSAYGCPAARGWPAYVVLHQAARYRSDWALGPRRPLPQADLIETKSSSRFQHFKKIAVRAAAASPAAQLARPCSCVRWWMWCEASGGTYWIHVFWRSVWSTQRVELG
jgi:hypothetical protein